ncbi:zinc finger protein [Aulographum hederae CBS 113979]|uniref:Zinc finger protein n=1 Tax=Aulographum hederae CBS 113979 TaxID=1176131 RepID=A0A6G1GRQ5_9PEZI|nr:zinc finger protein [Aulographum hederae CBS 113979]
MYYNYECDTCTRTFANQAAVNQHMNALDHWAPRFNCESCGRDFSSQNAANQHMNAVSLCKPRFECETCTSKFHSQAAANDHMRAVGHLAPRYPCEACNKVFRSQQAAREHMESDNHWRKHYCSDCDRGFQNQNNLNMHLNSRVHRGNQVPCPFCRTAFATASGVSHHLESSSCSHARNVNRETIYEAIKSRDRQGLITKNLLTYPDQPSSGIATAATWNGHRYECYLCHRSFTSTRALDQHLASPVHQQKVYHCPNRQCGRDLVSLAALFNHLESESCGFIRFEKVQQNVNGFLTGKQRLIAFS